MELSEHKLHIIVQGINTSESTALWNMFEIPSITYANKHCDMTSPTHFMHLCSPCVPCGLKELLVPFKGKFLYNLPWITSEIDRWAFITYLQMLADPGRQGWPKESAKERSHKQMPCNHLLYPGGIVLASGHRKILILQVARERSTWAFTCKGKDTPTRTSLFISTQFLT